MARLAVERHCKQPDWALMLVATLPFDRNKSYPDIERYVIMGCILNHIMDFTYRRRNAMQRLADTHSIRCKEYSITIATLNDKPVLTIHLIVDNKEHETDACRCGNA